MKYIRVFLFAIIIVFMYGCDIIDINNTDNTDNTENQEHNIIFKIDGAIHKNLIVGEDELILPDDPVKEGYNFDGWFLDEVTFSNQFDILRYSEENMDSDIIVFGKWSTSNNVSTETYTVNYMMDISEEYYQEEVPVGSKLSAITDPTKPGYYFNGWCKDVNLISYWNYSMDVVNNDVTLYAKWSDNYDSSFKRVYEVDESKEFIDIKMEDNKVTTKFRVGTVSNVVLDQLTTAVINQPGTVISVSSTQISEESISATIGQTFSFTTGFDYGIKFEATLETSLSVSATTSKAIQMSQGFSRNLDEYEMGLFYTIVLVGNYDIFQTFILDQETGEMENIISYETVGAVSLTVVSTEDNNFYFELSEPTYILEHPDMSLIYENGQGTLENPYEIGTEDQFIGVFLDLGSNYVLVDDIEFLKYHGTSAGIFFGTLDGNNHYLSGLDILIPSVSYVESESIGLFSVLQGTIRNLEIKDSKITLEPNHDGSGQINAGLLAGESVKNSIIDNITIRNSQLELHRKNSRVGGIVGKSNSSITNSSIYTTTIYGNGDLGGVVGNLYDGGLIDNCLVTGEIIDNVMNYSRIEFYSLNENRSSGGLVGFSIDSTISNSIVTFTEFVMRGSRDSRPNQGYIVGHLKDGIISHVSWSDNVKKDQIVDWCNFWGTCWKDYYLPSSHPYCGRLSGNNVIE